MKKTCFAIPALVLECFHKLFVLAPLFLVFEGTTQVWTQVPTPNPGGNNNILRGISGTSSSDIWTVGYYETTPGSYQYQNLILHWNGTSWQQYTTVNYSNNSDLYDVEAVSATEVWAAGLYSGGGGGAQPQLLKWNGSTWTQQSLPAFINSTATASIWSLDAIAPNDIWAVGGTYNMAYALHYNGSSWHQVTVPQVGLLRDELNAVHGLASNDVWAVGSYRDGSGQYRCMARRWNGSTWTNSTLPASLNGVLAELLDVRMIATNDVWAIGVNLSNGSIIKLHWNGSTWTHVTPANGGGGALAPLASNDVFSVGNNISRWNGSSWAVVESLSHLAAPALRNTYVAPNGDVWAAGRTSEGTNQFKTLVYRTANSTPVFTHGPVQSVFYGTNSSNNTIDQRLTVTSSDVSQVLTYTVVTPPANGTLSGFPATAVTSNGTATPSGLSYTPTPGYTGGDQFVVQVAVGSLTAQTTINLSIGGVLPLNLLSFRGRFSGNDAVVQWQTSNETGISRFILERSDDGTRYAPVALIAATGQGWYQFADRNRALESGYTYYRLQAEKHSGKTNYSQVLVLAPNHVPPVVLLFPNPVVDKATLLVSSKKQDRLQYTVTDATGRVIQRQTVLVQEGSNAISLNVSSLKAGFYSIMVESGSHKKQLHWIKQ